MKQKLTICVMTVLAISLQVGTARAELRSGDCRIGIYRLSDGSDIDIGLLDGTHLRWRRKDGTTGKLTETGNGTWTSTLGWTDRPDGTQVSFPDCAKGLIAVNGLKGKRIKFDVKETRFKGTGVSLSGRLVMPKGNDRVPIAVLVHGSEHFSARDFYSQQRMFPSDGIGVFVYDKRGTGASGGTYTQDFELLAKDAVAAMREARRLAGRRAGRIGYQAGSAGGWVAPLAATKARVDFIVVGFGLAVSPLEEERSAIVQDMKRQGYGPDIIAKALKVADATAAILSSGFKDGYDRLYALRDKYGKEPWFKHVHGDVTFLLFKMSEAELRKNGPALFAGVPVHYDPMPVLHRLTVPQLWILGGEDSDAPSAETARRLKKLAAGGKPIITAVFPTADHGIYEFETDADGKRVFTRNSEGYYAMMRDFIRTARLKGAYGDSVISRPQK